MVHRKEKVVAKMGYWVQERVQEDRCLGCRSRLGFFRGGRVDGVVRKFLRAGALWVHDFRTSTGVTGGARNPRERRLVCGRDVDLARSEDRRGRGRPWKRNTLGSLDCVLCDILCRRKVNPGYTEENTQPATQPQNADRAHRLRAGT